MVSIVFYSFYICGDDLVFEGRGWNTRSDKVNYEHLYWDGKSIDIGYIGVFDRKYPYKIFNITNFLRLLDNIPTPI